MARAAFDAAEQARIEALGSRNMAGVGANLDAALEMRLKADPIARATARDEVPLSTALALMCARAVDRKAGARARAAAGVDLVRDWIEEKAGSGPGRAAADARRSGKLCRSGAAALTEPGP